MTSYDKFKSYSYCVGGRLYTSTINIKPDIIFNKKTKKENKSFIVECSLCKRSKTKIVSDNTKGLQDSFRSVSKAAKNLGKK